MKQWRFYLHKLWASFCLRCPRCEQGLIFTGLFRMNETCPHCGVRFERQDGESVGGMYINLGMAELTAIGGYFLIDALFKPPFGPHVAFWLLYNVVFITVFYRHSRALWVGIVHLTGGLYDAPVEGDAR